MRTPYALRASVSTDQPAVAGQTAGARSSPSHVGGGLTPRPDALIVLAREILDISRRYLHEDFKRSWEEAGLVPDRPRDQLEAPYRWAPKGDPWAPVEAL
jgi:hypothetical protein